MAFGLARPKEPRARGARPSFARRLRTLAVLVALPAAGCSEKKSAPPPAPPPPAPAVAPADAGVHHVPPGGDPSGMHLDDDATAPFVASPPPAGRTARPIDVTLRSTPPGAQVAVDGTVIGSTPAFWNGLADGREHQFVFTLRGHAIARYRFVPVASGVIHARLEPILEEPAAGVPPPAVVPPAPSPTTPPAAPPTVVKPVETPSAVPPASPENPAVPPVGPQP